MTQKYPDKKPYILIGYMGSGKSYVCKRLGAAMDLRWVDLDDVIEARAGKSISDIFNEDGHEAFRLLEHNCLVDLLNAKDYDLISAGGGAPCYLGNMDLMNARAITIYLRREATEILKYVLPGISHRPLLAGKSEEEIVRFVEETLKDREPIYSQAQYILEGFESQELLDKVASIILENGKSNGNY